MKTEKQLIDDFVKARREWLRLKDEMSRAEMRMCQAFNKVGETHPDWIDINEVPL